MSPDLPAPPVVAVSPDGRELVAALTAFLAAAGAGSAGSPGRLLLGISGAPGAGKSTLAHWLATRAGGGGAVVVPMDGFHLADAELVRRGLRDRKGAPETFDAAGYAVLLERVRRASAGEDGDVVMAPAFERGLEQPLAGAIPVEPDVRLVVTEGNYLLLEAPPWPRVCRQLDAVWHVVTDDALRRERLIARHVASGKDPAAARAWVARVDDPNAALVAAGAHRADLVLDLTAWADPSV